WEPGAPAFTINLSHLPMSAEDHKVIEAAVGAGAVQMMSRGFGNCRISSTDVRHVWKVQYLNNAPARLMILNTLVVAGLPEEAVAASEDLADSAVRIKELIEWVTKSWELSPVEVK
ncbi:hydrogenase expression/formation C-terminal domain-containing protein, partial [Parasutterella sp.]